MRILSSLYTIFPEALPYNFTDLGAVSDRDLGALIVRDSGSNVTLSVDVAADPCPNVSWIFNGMKLGPSNETFVYNNSCVSANARSPNWTFTLNTRLLGATSGNYSASFSNIAGTSSLHVAYLTVPGICHKIISYSRVSLPIRFVS